MKKLTILAFVAIGLMCAAGPADAADEPELVKSPLQTTPEHLVQQVFFAAEMQDYRMFYKDLCDRSLCPMKDIPHKRFKEEVWNHFLLRFGDYLVDDTSMFFKIEKRRPAKVTKRTNRLIIWIPRVKGEQKTGSIELRRGKDKKWKVYKFNL